MRYESESEFESQKKLDSEFESEFESQKKLEPESESEFESRTLTFLTKIQKSEST